MPPVAAVPASAEHTASAAQLQSLVQAEQVRLSVEQVRRIPLPHLLLDVCLAWTAWNAGVGRMAWIWCGVMTVAQLGRTGYLVRLNRKTSLPPGAMLSRAAHLLCFLGALHAVLIVLVFMQPPGNAQYILTMILVGNAAGAVSPAAGHLRSYLQWAVVFGGSLALSWAFEGTLEGGAIAVLIVFLFVILSLYVRDEGRTLTKLVSLSESLRRVSEAKTRFFAAASHDLRQPLTALSYNAATVQALAQASGDATLNSVSEGIRRALAESRGLLDSLLEVSELDAGVVRAECTSVDLVALVTGVRDGLEPLANERDLRLVLRPGQAELHAFTDPTLLRRIVQNLVGNAIKFTQQGEVVLAVEPGEVGTVLVRVADTGPGIPPEAHDKVFEEFFQIGNVERNRSRGLGLGLAIVRRLAGLIGAEVRLRSAIGAGSTFEVVLPRSNSPGPALSAASSCVAPEPIRARRVLVVDDEREVRDALTTMLTTLGWEVQAVPGPDEAIASWHAGFMPHAIVVDFRLRGGTSGLEVLASLRELGCRAPAWMVTGDTEPARIVAARDAGVPVVYKPVDGWQLAALLDAGASSTPSPLNQDS